MLDSARATSSFPWVWTRAIGPLLACRRRAVLPRNGRELREKDMNGPMFFPGATAHWSMDNASTMRGAIDS